MVATSTWKKSGIKNRAAWDVLYTPRKKATQEGLIISDCRIVRICGHVTWGIELMNA